MFEKVLKDLGFDSKHVSEIAKAVKDGKDDIDTAPMIEAYKASQKKLMENDPDLVASIAGKEKGKILDIVTRKIKSTFGLDSAAIKDKEIEDVIGLAKAESTKGLSKDLQTLQAENVELTNKVKDYEDTKIPAIKSEVEVMKKDFKVLTKIQKKIPADNLRNPFDFVEENVVSKLRQLYDIDLDEKDDPIILQKGGKLQVKSADGTKLLTFDEAIMDILKKGQFIKESNADNAGKKNEIQPAAPTKPEPAAQKPVPVHLDRAAQHLAEMQKKKTTA